MFLLAFHAFLRVGEFTFKAPSSSHNLSISDITIQSKSLVLSFRSFKHSKGKHPQLKICSRKSVCPVKHLARYIKLRPKGKGPLFVFPDASPVTASYFYRILKKCLVVLSLDVRHYNGHSFRIGAATTAASQGFSDAQIAAMGRWSSDAFKRYIQIPTMVL